MSAKSPICCELLWRISWYQTNGLISYCTLTWLQSNFRYQTQQKYDKNITKQKTQIDLPMYALLKASFQSIQISEATSSLTHVCLLSLGLRNTSDFILESPKYTANCFCQRLLSFAAKFHDLQVQSQTYQITKRIWKNKRQTWYIVITSWRSQQKLKIAYPGNWICAQEHHPVAEQYLRVTTTVSENYSQCKWHKTNSIKKKKNTLLFLSSFRFPFKSNHSLFILRHC